MPQNFIITHISFAKTENNYFCADKGFCVPTPESMHALCVPLLLSSLLLSSLPPTGMSPAHVWNYTLMDLALWFMGILKWQKRCKLCLHFHLWQERRRARQPAAAGRRGRNEAYLTGVCGRLTSLDGWRSCERRLLTGGCRTWLASFGPISPSAGSLVMTVLSPILSLKSEADQDSECSDDQ